MPLAIPLPDFSDTTTVGVLTAIGVVLAAVAAFTGIVSVRQGSRAWRAASRPLLHMTVFRHPETGECTIEILNTGGATALGATFLFASGTAMTRGRFGNLAPGSRLVLTTEPMPDPTRDGLRRPDEAVARRLGEAGVDEPRGEPRREVEAVASGAVRAQRLDG